MAINPALPKTGGLSELTRRSETDKVTYVYYGLHVQYTSWSERMRNITVVRGILRPREAAYHPKMQENVTFQGLNCAEFDNKRHTGASTTGEAWCYVPICQRLISHLKYTGVTK